MGYSITFTLKTDELDSKFIPTYKDLDKLNEAISEEKLSILLYAMSPLTDQSHEAVIRVAKLSAKYYILLLEDLAKHQIYDSIAKDGEVDFYGWNRAEPSDIDKQSVLESLIENICFHKYLIPTPDYFEDDEKFYDKRNEIMSRLDIEEMVFDYIYDEFREMYYDKSDEAQLHKNEASSLNEEEDVSLN